MKEGSSCKRREREKRLNSVVLRLSSLLTQHQSASSIIKSSPMKFKAKVTSLEWLSRVDLIQASLSL